MLTLLCPHHTPHIVPQPIFISIRTLLRVGSAWVVAFFFTCTPRSSWADEPSGLDAVPVRLSTTATPFALSRGAGELAGMVVRSRLGYLDRPLSIVVASPDPQGTRSDVVRGAVGLEFAFSRRWRSGLDVGMNWGAHLFQFGEGSSVALGEESKLPAFSVMDPMLEVGFTKSWRAFSLRPFVALYVPLGTKAGYTAERHTRVEGGVSTFHQIAFFDWGAEASILYRAPLEFSSTHWGAQAKFSLSAQARIGKHFALGPELVVRPILVSQPTKGSSLLPALALLGVGYKHQRIAARLNYGLGLPISGISTDVAKKEAFRAPSTPVQSVFVDLEFFLR